MSVPSKKSVIDFRIIGLMGSLMMLISEFVPWFSNFSLIYIFIIGIKINLVNSSLYLFPLMSGIISLIGNLLILKKKDFKINSVIINLIGLSFLLLFLVYIIPNEIIYLTDAGVGFYICIIGFILVFLDLMIILLNKED